MGLTLFACQDKSSERFRTFMDSDDFSNPQERVEALRAEIRSFSSFEDAEFELFNVNGFSNTRNSSIPGASSWDYKFALRLDPANLERWTEEMVQVEFGKQDLSWTQAIVRERKDQWKVSSPPIVYTSQGAKVTVFVYEKEGILFKRVIGE